MSTALVPDFQAITGASDKNAKKFLKQANGNLELALSLFFDAGIEPESVPPPVSAEDTLAAVQAEAARRARTLKGLLANEYVCALVGADGRSEAVAVTLAGVRVHARMLDTVAAIKVWQRFRNTTDHNVEATFVFRAEEASVCGFAADMGGHKVVGSVDEKARAFERYDEAIATGDGALLLEHATKVDDAALKLSLGNMAPGEEATVVISYVAELPVLNTDATLLRLPITRAPIGNGGGDGETTDADGLVYRADEAVVGSEWQVPDGLSVDVEVSVPAGSVLDTVTSPSHNVDVNRGTDTFANVKMGAALDGSRQTVFELCVKTADPHEARACVELPPDGATSTAGGSEAGVMLTFYPELDEGDEDEETEMIFLLDRSGSMAGGLMRQARNALQLFLRSIPLGTRFNIYGFGSSFQKLFPASVVYNTKTFKAASAAVARMEADLGGTDILPPLRDIFRQETDPAFPRQIFVLTDGEVNDTRAVINTVRDSALATRVFTLGIGDEASRPLVQGMATAGNGVAEFVRSGVRLEPAVLRLVQRGIQPVLRNVSLDWGALAADGRAVEQSPSVIRPIFDGDKVVVYGLVPAEVVAPGGACADAFEVTLSADFQGERVEFAVTVDPAAGKEDAVITRLAARALIRQLERAADGGSENSAAKDRATALSIKYMVLSRYTSFVAEVEREEGADGAMQSVVVDPVEAAYQDGRAKESSSRGRRNRRSSIERVNAEVHEVRGHMAANIESLLERGDRIDSLVDRSDDLSAQSMTFRQKSARAGGGGGFMSWVKSKFSSSSNDYESSHASPQMAAAPLYQSAGADFANPLYGDQRLGGENRYSAPEQSKRRGRPQAAAFDDDGDEQSCASSSSSSSSCLSGSGSGSAGEEVESRRAAPAPVPSSRRAHRSSGRRERKVKRKGKRKAPGAGAMGGKADLAELVLNDASLRPLDAVVLLQQATGAWEPTADLCAALGRAKAGSGSGGGDEGLALAALMAAIPEALASLGGGGDDGGSEETAETVHQIWATLVAVAALRAWCGDAEDEWMLIATKAGRWVKRSLKTLGAGETLGDHQAAAAAFVDRL